MVRWPTRNSLGKPLIPVIGGDDAEVNENGDDVNRLDVPAVPIVDECFARLHAAGWSIGDYATATGWTVTGANGENVIEAHGRTQGEAWLRAVEHARAVGMDGGQDGEMKHRGRNFVD